MKEKLPKSVTCSTFIDIKNQFKLHLRITYGQYKNKRKLINYNALNIRCIVYMELCKVK